jgi:hypothetical protein
MRGTLTVVARGESSLTYTASIPAESKQPKIYVVLSTELEMSKYGSSKQNID